MSFEAKERIGLQESMLSFSHSLLLRESKLVLLEEKKRSGKSLWQDKSQTVTVLKDEVNTDTDISSLISQQASASKEQTRDCRFEFSHFL